MDEVAYLMIVSYLMIGFFFFIYLQLISTTITYVLLILQFQASEN